MGKIYLTHEAQTILEKFPQDTLRIFETEEFKIAHAKEVINEAYVFEKQNKTIAIISKIFNIEAQNALLKILEEPPKGVEFLIFTINKNALLPTIRSRMQIINLICKTPISPLNLNLTNLTLQNVYDFLKSLDSLPRTQSKEVIQSLLKNIQESKIRLPQKELDFFNTAIQANIYYEKLHHILLPILLYLVENK